LKHALGDTHFDALAAEMALAEGHLMAGDLVLAAEHLVHVRLLLASQPRTGDPDLLWADVVLAHIWREIGPVEESEPLLRNVLPKLEAAFGAAEERTLVARLELLVTQGNHVTAEGLRELGKDLSASLGSPDLPPNCQVTALVRDLARQCSEIGNDVGASWLRELIGRRRPLD
jgi:hypothetical protein